MQWNTNTDTLIMDWPTNHTPSSCIHVNIVLMEHTVATNITVIVEALCVKYIRNPSSAMSMVTKYCAGKAIDIYKQVTQKHNTTAGDKGTEIVYCIYGSLTKNSKLKSICLVRDIIAEDGTTKTQSAAVLHQFSEFGYLLQGWHQETDHMYAHDPKLPAFVSMRWYYIFCCQLLSRYAGYQQRPISWHFGSEERHRWSTCLTMSTWYPGERNNTVWGCNAKPYLIWCVELVIDESFYAK